VANDLLLHHGPRHTQKNLSGRPECLDCFVHGGNMVIFYYEQGLRTAWAQIKKGMAVYIPAGMAHQVWNEDEEPAECILIMFGKGA